MREPSAQSPERNSRGRLEPMYAAELPRLPYERAWELQTRLVRLRTSGRLDRDVLLLLEHPPVMTVGRRGLGQDLLIGEAELAAQGIGLVHIERGGQITYHGPGQLIAYPIVRLRAAGLRLTDFVFRLEEIMLRTAADFGVQAERSEVNRGVFVGERKLGSLGVAVKRGVSFHGLALNVDLDLEPFNLINPCGLADVRMTSLALEAGRRISLASARSSARRHAATVFNRECQPLSVSHLEALAGGDHEPDPCNPEPTRQAPLA